MHRADKAIEELKNGNMRFLEKHMENIEITVDKTKKLYNKPQKPMAVVLACSDSRVPPEIVFDQGPGSLFVIRNAGNVIDKHVLGSIEYAIKYLNTPLIFVLGHNMCGAINATIKRESLSPNIDCIVNNILKNIDIEKLDFSDENKAAEILENENIKRGIIEIRENNIVKDLEKKGKVKVRGGKYCLDTGVVKFF